MSTIESNTRTAYTRIRSEFNIPASLADLTDGEEIKESKGEKRKWKTLQTGRFGGGVPGGGRMSPADLVSEAGTDGAS